MVLLVKFGVESLELRSLRFLQGIKILVGIISVIRYFYYRNSYI